MHRLIKSAASWVALSRQNFNQRPVRIEETNTFCEGGLAGVSDTFAAAIYIIDYSLSMLAAGISGLNYHSSQCYPYSPIYAPNSCAGRIKGIHSTGCSLTCGDQEAAPIINAPLYGLLFTQMVLSGLPSYYQGVSMMRPGCPVQVKQHILRSSDGTLRIVLIQKSIPTDQNKEAIDLSVPIAVHLHGQYSNAKMSVLSAPSLASKVSDIKINGQQMGLDGQWTGSEQNIKIKSFSNSTSSWFEFDLSFTSRAVLLELSPLK